MQGRIVEIEEQHWWKGVTFSHITQANLMKRRKNPSPGVGEITPDFGKHKQISAGKHGVQAVFILFETTVRGFPVSKLTFDDVEDMLHLTAYRGFEILNVLFPVNPNAYRMGEGTGAAVDAVIYAGKTVILHDFQPF